MRPRCWTWWLKSMFFSESDWNRLFVHSSSGVYDDFSPPLTFWPRNTVDGTTFEDLTYGRPVISRNMEILFATAVGLEALIPTKTVGEPRWPLLRRCFAFCQHRNVIKNHRKFMILICVFFLCYLLFFIFKCLLHKMVISSSHWNWLRSWLQTIRAT